MKIGILTFHRAHNYGAVLQAYALMHYLSKNVSEDVTFIDYCPKYFIESYYRLCPVLKYCKKTKTKIKIFIFYYLSILNRLKKRQVFNSFIQKEFKVAKYSALITTEDILKQKNHYDVIFYESDQIWSKILCVGFDEVFWGGFLPNVWSLFKAMSDEFIKRCFK